MIDDLANRSHSSRRHAMRFGTTPLSGGMTRFNLWAPKAKTVHLCRSFAASQASVLPLDPADPGVPREMIVHEEGWFSLEAFAPPGTHYHFRIDDRHDVPDPASRHQPDGVHGDSRVVDPGSFHWLDESWRGRPWHEAIVHELHVGTFSPEGTFDGITRRLEFLADLGVTALELMPLADFPGRFGWGYDGVALFAPCSRYGDPDTLKNLVQEAHRRGLMVLLDVVYNHFGPEGNYLHLYAPSFVHRDHHTPWGRAMNFDGPNSRWVRQFFIDNALYWIEEFHFDGLRLDAVQAIEDRSPIHILDELQERIASGPGKKRQVHLVFENGDNATRFLIPNVNTPHSGGRCQWNDDFHHSAHVLLTGEKDGYYRDYHPDPLGHLVSCLTTGFSFQGMFSPYFNKKRGSPSAHLPGECFINFLQNHDQTGNRPQGERIHALAPDDAVRAMTVLLMLAPYPPMLFMGQEWGSRTPFCFFSDLEPALHSSIVSGRMREMHHFFRLRPGDPPPPFPDPMREETFLAAKLDWNETRDPQHRSWIHLHQELIRIRKQELWPRLGARIPLQTLHSRHPSGTLAVSWSLPKGEMLHLLAHLFPTTPHISHLPKGHCLFATVPQTTLPRPWYVGWFIEKT
ncbi:MAG: malto-oligosyltrehalose trehalohydrolase [Magnetococcales bacterium]|nr:malto-oligosyltrehalose trehalohydrolase [Magnetococcales bacterium]